jgi:hypothetical protein
MYASAAPMHVHFERQSQWAGLRAAGRPAQIQRQAKARTVESLDVAQLIALAAVLGFASGIRLYAVLLVTGLVGYAGWVELPGGLAILQHPWVLIASGLMFLVEFVADKVPGVDTVWDAIQTFIRIPAGAALAAGVFGGMDSAAWTLAAAILGGSLAATSHFTKAGTRAAANTSPEPFSNVGLSIAEDVGTAGLLWLVLTYPLVALALVVVFVLAAAWLLPKLVRFVARLLRALIGDNSGVDGSGDSGTEARR